MSPVRRARRIVYETNWHRSRNGDHLCCGGLMYYLERPRSAQRHVLARIKGRDGRLRFRKSCPGAKVCVARPLVDTPRRKRVKTTVRKQIYLCSGAMGGFCEAESLLNADSTSRRAMCEREVGHIRPCGPGCIVYRSKRRFQDPANGQKRSCQIELSLTRYSTPYMVWMDGWMDVCMFMSHGSITTLPMVAGIYCPTEQ